MTLILASGSPRRRELLGRLGIPFDVVPSTVEEWPPREGEDPASYALSLAIAKAGDVAARRTESVVLGADTVVVIEQTILNKPESREDAARMLRILRGREHTVITAVCVVCHGKLRSRSVAARVRMRTYSDDEIEAYVDSGEPMDKAGAYAVQGLGGALVESVDGCYETVVGLPLCLVSDRLEECGIARTAAQSPLCNHGLLS